MSLPRSWLSTRRMMAWVVIVGLALGFATEHRRRRRRFEAIALDHYRQMTVGRPTFGVADLKDPVFRWHLTLVKKYEHAARFP